MHDHGVIGVNLVHLTYLILITFVSVRLISWTFVMIKWNNLISLLLSNCAIKLWIIQGQPNGEMKKLPSKYFSLRRKKFDFVKQNIQICCTYRSTTSSVKQYALWYNMQHLLSRFYFLKWILFASKKLFFVIIHISFSYLIVDMQCVCVLREIDPWA